VERFYNHLKEEEESAMNVTTIGLEACGGAHYWARELIKLGQ
jgi:transposase